MDYRALDVESIQSRLSAAPVGHTISYLAQVTSTMDVAREKAVGRAPEGLVVAAEEQTAGRGRFGRNWVSVPGKNLSFSVVLYPNLWVANRLAIGASVAVMRAIREATGLQPSVKWPNDVMVNGKKVCGILVETEVQNGGVRHAILGVGVNVNLDPPAHLETGYRAGCLAAELGEEIPREELFRAVLEELGLVYAELKGWGLSWEEWQATMETLGQEVRVQWDTHVEEGVAERVDPDGNLVLSRGDGTTTTISAGEVTLQRR